MKVLALGGDNMDKKRIIKNVTTVLIFVIALGFISSWVKNSVNITPVFIVFDTYVLIIPCINLTVGIICYIASLFVSSQKENSVLKRSALGIAVFCIIFSVSFAVAVLLNSADKEISGYKEALESKYNLENFIDLNEYSLQDKQSDCEQTYSNGIINGYYNSASYAKNDGSYNYYSVTVYEYSGGTALERTAIKNRLENQLFRENSVSGKRIKYTENTVGEYSYKYCNYTDKFEQKSKSNFSVIAESNDKVIVYMIQSEYEYAFGQDINADKIIETICK